LWAEHYGKDLSLPHKAQFIKQERGDTEGQIHPVSPSGSFLNFPWVDFLVVAIGTFIVLELLQGKSSNPDQIPFLYDIISEETELMKDSGGLGGIVVYKLNLLPIMLISAGVLLLSGSIFYSYYQGHP